MGAPRTLATALLRYAIRVAPEASGEWAAAMLRELDFVEGDWAALIWALGSTTVILRDAASACRERLKGKTKEEVGMNNTGKKALGVGLGLFSALALVGCAFATLRISGLLFPGLEHSPWAYWLAVMIIPEAIFIIATIALWRKRGPVAAGILATGLMMALHVAVHFSMR
ncbi:MAG: hypothetical protein ABSF28_09060 [Terracidiphilus sp.]|jgi:hypothetical protein